MTCQQSGCEEEATNRVYWPGQATNQCTLHTAKLVALGEVMGFHVETAIYIEFDPNEPEDEPPYPETH